MATVAVALAIATGCERPPEPVEDREFATAAMTEGEFVDHVAALTVAVEDGLTGEEARDRAAELGGARYARDEVEAFADLLRADPVKWAAVADRIDERIAEIRGTHPDGVDRFGGTVEWHEVEGVPAGKADGSADAAR